MSNSDKTDLPTADMSNSDKTDLPKLKVGSKRSGPPSGQQQQKKKGKHTTVKDDGSNDDNHEKLKCASDRVKCLEQEVADREEELQTAEIEQLHALDNLVAANDGLNSSLGRITAKDPYFTRRFVEFSDWKKVLRSLQRLNSKVEGCEQTLKAAKQDRKLALEAYDTAYNAAHGQTTTCNCKYARAKDV